MKTTSMQLIHAGINFFTIPGVTLSNQSYLKFQQEINISGLEFSKFEKAPDNSGFKLTRESPSPLEIIVANQQPAISQLTIIAPYLNTPLELFINEVEAVVNAYAATWPAETRQTVRTDGTLRELLEASSEYHHAFQELWESRLKQSTESLKVFGKPIRGGGLRFVLDPIKADDDPVQIEVKIESYLQDTRKIFVETIFNWIKQSEIKPKERIHSMEEFVKNRVHPFIFGE